MQLKKENTQTVSNAVLCRNVVKRYGGREKACGGVYCLLPVFVEKDGKNTNVCDLVYCPICHRMKRGENGRPVAVGPYLHKADYKLFNVPREWWQGDWEWRQKFAWEVVSLAAAEDGSCGSGIVLLFDDVADKVGCAPVENKHFKFDERSIFGYEEE